MGTAWRLYNNSMQHQVLEFNDFPDVSYGDWITIALAENGPLTVGNSFVFLLLIVALT